tara:strand:+ start:6920 stop:8269 length:1350 start_codon:yes stop_codon:yes gene_type:complete
MKKYFLIALTAITLIACGQEKKGDTNPDNIIPETASNSSSETVKAVSHFPVSEDMTEVDNSLIAELPSEKLRESVQAKLFKDGKRLDAINSDNTIYKVASATTTVSSNKPGFINSRNVAFASAELKAKMSIIQMKKEAITSGRDFMSFENYGTGGQDPESVKKASYLDKLKQIADKSLDRALEELGVENSEIAKLNVSEKEQMYNNSFNNLVSSYAAEMLKGVTVVKIVEGEIGNNDYEVAVCVKYSPEQQAEAQNMESLGASNEVYNSKTLAKIMDLEPEKLISKLGSQIFKDENGNRFLIGFGQTSVQKVERNQSRRIQMGENKARLMAVQNIYNFLGEDLVTKEKMTQVEKDIQYVDNSEEYFSEDSYRIMIKSKTGTMQFPTSQIKTWRAIHPVSNHLVVGTMVILNKSNNLDFSNSNSAANNKSKSKAKRSDFIESSDIDGEDF